MRKASIVTTLLLLTVATSMYAYVAPEAGKVYRIYNCKTQMVVSEDCIARELLSADATTSNNDFKQLWVLTANGTGYSVQNAYSGQYIQHNPTQSSSYTTGTTEVPLYFEVAGKQIATATAVDGTATIDTKLTNESTVIMKMGEYHTKVSIK